MGWGGVNKNKKTILKVVAHSGKHEVQVVIPNLLLGDTNITFASFRHLDARFDKETVNSLTKWPFPKT